MYADQHDKSCYMCATQPLTTDEAIMKKFTSPVFCASALHFKMQHLKTHVTLKTKPL